MSDSVETKVAVHDVRISNLEKTVETKVGKDEFTPVRAVVYGFAAMLLAGVVGGLMTLLKLPTLTE
jgi:hypothetical protein